ncbi:MAG: 4Fe-4S dicluster domain-containing protein, partial [Deltaproteobacteria bacterium]|nr:4Fe-4S dicluster domain-containing protein [Deltaproteobacteria bacterium]
MHVQPGPGQMGSGVAPELQATYSELRLLPLFDGIPNEDLWRAIASGGVHRHELDRDVFVDTQTGHPYRGEVPPVYLVVEGQVAVAVFDHSILAERREQQAQFAAMSAEQREELSLVKPPPLARASIKNLASFSDGDIYNAAALPNVAGGEGGREVAFYTVEPSTVAAVAHPVIADLAARFPFFEKRLRRAIEIGRERLRNIAGVKQEILDFFIRQGISVSGEMVRVRQLDRCIDCKLCEEGCEERYGAKRLTLNGYKLGMLDFVYACRTCTDQRCIDPCEYDSIKFDEEEEEGVINEASCVGCILCAQACPYSAIEMIDVEDPSNPMFSEDFKLRLEEDGSLAFGPGKPRVARARRIANKCDHCADYGDQACVSACPTGALIEVSAYELFQERSPKAVELARTGYDQDLRDESLEYLPVHPFTEGVGVSDSGMAKTRRNQLGPLMMWGIGLGAWLLCTVEILLRLYSPAHSFQYIQLSRAGTARAEAVSDVLFRPGTELALWCGYIGTALMLVAAIYPIWR